MAKVVPDLASLVTLIVPVLLHTVVANGQSNPVPCPTGFVVKNGSKMRDE